MTKKTAPKPGKEKEKQEASCSFCLTPKSQIDLLVCIDDTDDTLAICDHCVGVAALLVEEYHRKRDTTELAH